MSDRRDEIQTQNLPEPKPMAIEPSVDVAARAFFSDLSGGAVDRSQLSPPLDARLKPNFLSSASALIATLGAPVSMDAFEVRQNADDSRTYYRIRFPEQTLTWVFGQDRDGKITGFSLQESPRRKFVSAWLRNIEY